MAAGQGFVAVVGARRYRAGGSCLAPGRLALLARSRRLARASAGVVAFLSAVS
jgi:hypothetical protein